jgi:hypothetical protein
MNGHQSRFPVRDRVFRRICRNLDDIQMLEIAGQSPCCHFTKKLTASPPIATLSAAAYDGQPESRRHP